ncbi:MAG: response regulator transcription factor [Acidobacteria bacterium]|nr:response regulator transcription factor [Acidobacteriota bacterium]
MKRRILIIEDDADIARSIAYNLERTTGLKTDWAADGESGLEKAFEVPPDLILLDLNLPQMNGVEICRRLRQESMTRLIPVLVLTARTGENDRVTCLDLGADDYMGKPFSMRELVARVRALIRRSYPAEQVAPYDDGLLRVDHENFQVISAGQEVRLTRKEFALFWLLVQNRGRVLTRDLLLDRVWGFSYGGETRTLDVHVRRLRKKLGEQYNFIETVVGVGYRFNPPNLKALSAVGLSE